MANFRNQPWLSSVPFIIAMLVMVFMVFTVLRVAVYPHDGIVSLSATGTVGEIEPGGPADGVLQVGDRITAIEGMEWASVFAAYRHKKGGEPVNLTILRDGSELSLIITLVDPPFREIFIRLVPLIVALFFWFVGIGVQTFKPIDGAGTIFFAWCQVSALTLSAGVASYLEPAWASMLFNSLLWMIGPLSVHLHLKFPQSIPERWTRALLFPLYLLASLGIALYLVDGISGIEVLSILPSLLSIGRVFLAVNLLIVAYMLYHHYRRPVIPGTRGKVRLVALGGGIAALAIVTLTLLPDGLFHQPILPYRFSFLLMLIIPITYGFAIYRLHLIEIERHINRGAAYFLGYLLLGSIYLLLYALLSRILPGTIASAPFINTLLVLFFVSVFSPLQTRVQRFVDQIFYGSWYDYRMGVMHITRGLEQITDLHSLAATVSRRLVDTLNLEESCAFLRGPEGDFSVIRVASRQNLAQDQQPTYPVLPRSSLTYLIKLGAVDRSEMERLLAEVTVTPEELELLSSEQIHLWVPVIGHGSILGLLALGPKIGGDVFSGEDLDILRVLASQMGPVVENLHLLTRLRNYAAELEQRVEERTAELFNAKERVEAILASVGDGVIVTDLDGTITTVNKAFELQSGYKAEEIIGRSLEILLAHENPSMLFDEIQETMLRGDVWVGELVNQRKNGEKYDVQLTFAPMRDQKGRTISYVGSQRDITRQKELDRLKDMFVADVSHELRTPTTNIGLYLDLLENAPPGKQAHFIQVVKDQSKQLSTLVEDILDLSRLERDRLRSTEYVDVDLNLLAEQSMVANQPSAESSGIQMVFEPQEGLPRTKGDADQIYRMITNLVSNAVNYTRQGEICVRTYETEKFVCLLVRDTGIGIRDEDKPHIFERFYRGRNVRQSKVHGTGLGLAIVKEIVELHGGKIEVESVLNQGSTFTVLLPK